jgi:hypothetical protein
MPEIDDDDTGATPDTTVDTSPDTTVDSSSDTTVETTSDASSDALNECYSIADGEEGVQCILDGVASGEIDPTSVGVVYLYPECGVAELQWTFDYYSLPDDEFDRVVAEAAACFQPLIESGEVSEYSLPPEFVYTDCLPGGNIYAEGRDEDFSEFLDCAYA